MKYIQIFADESRFAEMVHFLMGYGPFAAKLAQMNLKENDKCACGSEQTAKHLWESCAKSEFKHLRNRTELDKDTNKRKINA